MQNLQIKPTKPNLPNQTFQTKPTKPNQPNQTHQTKPTKPNQTYQTKPTKQNLPKTKPNLPNQTYPTKLTKPNLPNQTYQTKHTKPNLTYRTYQTKSNLAYQTYWTKPIKPKLLVKGVNAWVRSAFGNVFTMIRVFIIIFKISEFSSGVASTKLEQRVGHTRFHLCVLTECIVLQNIPAFSPISALAQPTKWNLSQAIVFA